MAFSYINEEDIYTDYEAAKKAMAPYFEPLDEYERIARNRPHPGIDKHLPKVTDGTLAALIQETPKRIIEQIPTGQVKSTDPWLDIVGTYIFTHEILPNANQVAALIQKCWALTSKTLTYGSQPTFVQFVNHGEYFGTDFTLPYIKDVLLEPGKLSDRDSNVIYLRAWYSKNQIKAIIAKEQMLGKSAKERGDSYQEGWNVEMLNKLIEDKGQAKPADNQTSDERTKSTNVGFYEVVHAFQNGIGATFYSFSPKLKEILRTKKNKDPRGFMPIKYMYANIDMSNPLGRGSVEISGGMQNLLDSETQSYQYMRGLMIDPPMEVRGSVVMSSVRYAPGARWNMGSNPNASVTPAKLETGTLQAFPVTSQLMRAQILALNGGGGDTTVGADAVGSQQSSKTPAGVKASQAKLGASDNYIRRQFEACFEEVAATMLNLYFAERSGVQELKLDQETAEKLEEIAPGSVQNQMIRIDYDTETEKLDFKVDATSSSQADDAEQLQALTELLQQTSQDPLIAWRMGQDGYKLNQGEAYKEMFEKMGIKNISRIITEMSPDEKQQSEQAKMPMVDKPKLTVAYDDLATNPQAQQAILSNAGVDLPIEVFQQALQTKAQLDAPPAQAPDNTHPIAKLLASLNIKFESLNAAAQEWILEQIMQMPPEAASGVNPSTIQAQATASDAAVRVAQLQHQAQNATDAHLQAAHSGALALAQAQQAEQQQQVTNAQADASHQLAVEGQKQAAKQPVGAK